MTRFVAATTLSAEKPKCSNSSPAGADLPKVSIPMIFAISGLSVIARTGSSADPRAALLSHRALVSNLDQLMAIDPPPVTESDVLLAVLPLFHVYGLNTVLGQAIVSGASIVLAQRFDPAGTLAAIAKMGYDGVEFAGY